MDLKRDPRARSKSPKAGRKTQRPRGVESERRLVARRLLERGTSTEGALGFKSVLDRATEVIGREREAFRWLGTPVRDLSYKTPISLLTNERGRKAVLAVLTRLEHGVFLILYRLCSKKYPANNGKGAALTGARWNPAGVEVIYTAPTLALATLEIIVHLAALPKDFVFTEIRVPDYVSIEHVADAQLPPDWNGLTPTPKSSQRFRSMGPRAPILCSFGTIEHSPDREELPAQSRSS